MASVLTIVFYLALAAVLVVLALGLVNLARTDEGRVSRSNHLMRLRVLFQFIAVMTLVGIGWLSGAFEG